MDVANNPPYITIIRMFTMGHYMVALLAWDSTADGYLVQAARGNYTSKDEAIAKAQEWAEQEGLSCRFI